MERYVAFLRGMNLGGRRITNDALCAHVRTLGLEDVSAFLASGNVLFAARRGSPAQIASRLQDGLGTALGYDVPTFVRTADEVGEITEHDPFDETTGADGGKLHVALLSTEPSTAARRKALAFATDADQLAIDGRELYWLPRGKLTESDLDLKALEGLLGTMTIRTRRTLERIAARLAGA